MDIGQMSSRRGEELSVWNEHCWDYTFDLHLGVRLSHVAMSMGVVFGEAKHL